MIKKSVNTHYRQIYKSTVGWLIECEFLETTLKKWKISVSIQNTKMRIFKENHSLNQIGHMRKKNVFFFIVRRLAVTLIYAKLSKFQFINGDFLMESFLFIYIFKYLWGIAYTY